MCAVLHEAGLGQERTLCVVEASPHATLLEHAENAVKPPVLVEEQANAGVVVLRDHNADAAIDQPLFCCLEGCRRVLCIPSIAEQTSLVVLKDTAGIAHAFLGVVKALAKLVAEIARALSLGNEELFDA